MEVELSIRAFKRRLHFQQFGRVLCFSCDIFNIFKAFMSLDVVLSIVKAFYRVLHTGCLYSIFNVLANWLLM